MTVLIIAKIKAIVALYFNNMIYIARLKLSSLFLPIIKILSFSSCTPGNGLCPPTPI